MTARWKRNIGRGMLATGLLLPGINQATAATFTVDGILTPLGDPYAYTAPVTYLLDTPGVGFGSGVANGRIWLGVGDNSATGAVEKDVFILFEVSTNVTDLTFLTGASPGWDGYSGDPKIPAIDKTTGSEKLKFKVDGKDFEVKLKVDGANGYTKNGNVIAGSTSFDYNIKKGAYVLPVDKLDPSPDCGRATSGHAATYTDAECYAYLAINSPDYQFAQRFELQIANPKGYINTVDSLALFAATMMNVEVHASPSKACVSGAVGISKSPFGSTVPQQKSPTCNGGGTVPEPSTVGLLGLVLTGLYWRRRRDARKVLAAA